MHLDYYYFPCNHEEMDSDVKKQEAVENSSNLVGNSFSHCTTFCKCNSRHVTQTPIACFGVFFSTLNMSIFGLEYLRVSWGNTQSTLLRRLLRPHRKEYCNHQSLPTYYQLSVFAIGIRWRSNGTFADPFLDYNISIIQVEILWEGRNSQSYIDKDQISGKRCHQECRYPLCKRELQTF